MHTSTSVGVVHDMGLFPSVLLLGTGPLPYIGRRSQTDNRDLPEKLWANCPLAEIALKSSRKTRDERRSLSNASWTVKCE
jgi:hypothetical protein